MIERWLKTCCSISIENGAKPSSAVDGVLNLSYSIHVFVSVRGMAVIGI